MPTWFRVLQNGGRLALAAVIVWIVVTTVGPFVLPSPSPPSGEAVEENVAPPVRQVLLSDFLDGHWTFGGVAWQIGMTRSDPEQLESELLKPPPQIEPSAAVESLQQDVIGLLKSLDASRSATEDSITYRLEHPSFRVIAFAALDGEHESLALVRIAWHKGAEGWMLIEARPAEDATPKETVADGLLPLPENSRRLAQRWDSQGRLIGEVASCDRELAQLGELWQREGWTLEQVEGLAAAGSHLACVRGEELLYVWSPSPTDGPRGLLFVIRAPGG